MVFFLVIAHPALLQVYIWRWCPWVFESASTVIISGTQISHKFTGLPDLKNSIMLPRSVVKVASLYFRVGLN